MRLTVLIAATIAFSGPLDAQEFKPLVEIFTQTARAYPLSRCAGFYLAVMEWSGAERMGDETWATSDAAREKMILYSAVTMQAESGGTIEYWVEITFRDVRNISDLYLKRFESNYAAVGQAFGEDALILSDLDFCKTLAESLP